MEILSERSLNVQGECLTAMAQCEVKREDEIVPLNSTTTPPPNTGSSLKPELQNPEEEEVSDKQKVDATNVEQPPLKLHIKLTPNQVKPFRKQFDKNGKQKERVKRSSEKKPFYCLSCDVKFFPYTVFQDHLISQHIRKAKPIVCIRQLPIPLEVLKQAEQWYKNSCTGVTSTEGVKDEPKVSWELAPAISFGGESITASGEESAERTVTFASNQKCESVLKTMLLSTGDAANPERKDQSTPKSETGSAATVQNVLSSYVPNFFDSAGSQPSTSSPVTSPPVTSTTPSATLEMSTEMFDKRLMEELNVHIRNLSESLMSMPADSPLSKFTHSLENSSTPANSANRRTLVPESDSNLLTNERCESVMIIEKDLVPPTSNSVAAITGQVVKGPVESTGPAVQHANPLQLMGQMNPETSVTRENADPLARPASVIVLDTPSTRHQPHNPMPSIQNVVSLAGNYDPLGNPWRNVPPPQMPQARQPQQQFAVPSALPTGPGRYVVCPPHVHQDPYSRCLCTNCKDIRSGDVLRKSEVNKDLRTEYNCNFCHKLFAHPMLFLRHVQAAGHGYCCELCNGAFYNKVDFETHKRLHMLKVLDCNRVAPSGDSGAGAVGQFAPRVQQPMVRPLVQHQAPRPPPLVSSGSFNSPRIVRPNIPSGVNVLRKNQIDDDVIVVGIERRQPMSRLPPPPPLERQLPGQSSRIQQVPSKAPLSTALSGNTVLQRIQGSTTQTTNSNPAAPAPVSGPQIARILRNSEITLTPIEKNGSAGSSKNSELTIRAIPQQPQLPKVPVSSQNSVTVTAKQQLRTINTTAASYSQGTTQIQNSSPTVISRQSAIQQHSNGNSYRLVPTTTSSVVNPAEMAARAALNRPLPTWHHPVGSSMPQQQVNRMAPQFAQQQHPPYRVPQQPLPSSQNSYGPNRYPPPSRPAVRVPHPPMYPPNTSNSATYMAARNPLNRTIGATTTWQPAQQAAAPQISSALSSVTTTLPGPSGNAAQNSPRLRCHVCNLSFPTINACQAHVSLVHLQQRQVLACKRCKKIYLNEPSLFRHEAVCTTKVACAKCQVPFYRDELMNHYAQVHYCGFPPVSTANVIQQVPANSAHTATAEGGLIQRSGLPYSKASSAEVENTVRRILDSCAANILQQSTAIVPTSSAAACASPTVTMASSSVANVIQPNTHAVIDIDVDVVPEPDSITQNLVNIIKEIDPRSTLVPENADISGTENASAMMAAAITESDGATSEVLQQQEAFGQVPVISAVASEVLLSQSDGATSEVLQQQEVFGQVEVVSAVASDVLLSQSVDETLQDAQLIACTDGEQRLENVVNETKELVETAAGENQVSLDNHKMDEESVEAASRENQVPQESAKVDEESVETAALENQVPLEDPKTDEIVASPYPGIVISEIRSENTVSMDVPASEEGVNGDGEMQDGSGSENLLVMESSDVPSEMSTEVKALESPVDSEKMTVPACPICDQFFRTKDELLSHLPMHQEVESAAAHRCYKCNQRFETRKKLVSHLRMHMKSCKDALPHVGKTKRRRIEQGADKDSQLVVALMDINKVMANVEFLRRIGVVGLITLKDLKNSFASSPIPDVHSSNSAIPVRDLSDFGVIDFEEGAPESS